MKDKGIVLEFTHLERTFMVLSLLEEITMIWIWRRKELYAGVSLEKFNEIRKTLISNDVHYSHKVTNVKKTSGFKKIKSGEHQDFSKMYYLYIDKKDYEKMKRLLR